MCGKRHTPIFSGTLCWLSPRARRPEANPWGHTALCPISGQSWDPTPLGPARRPGLGHTPAEDRAGLGSAVGPGSSARPSPR